jgi:hypothetical protein
MRTPASMKRGMAMSGQESRAVNMRWGINTKGVCESARSAKKDPNPRAKAMGMPMTMRTAIAEKRMISVSISPVQISIKPLGF